MRKNYIILIPSIFLILITRVLWAQSDLPAFPGAEGYGKYTTGGRGGKVIYVTNLEDNTSPGSLRYAIRQNGARTIVFAVSGTIRLNSNLNIKNGDITIAGQSAPGDGICLRDYPVVVEADNVIIRYMRFRMGDEAAQENDTFWGRNHSDIIIDHCTMSWSTDECASFYDNSNFTMQWCLLSESLRISVHEKGTHGYGGIWGGQKASFHHNLLAHHDSRNPRFCGSRYSNKANEELVDFRNNVLFNWGANTAYAAEGGSYNLINNYYKAGPASSNTSRIIQAYSDNGTNNQAAGIYGKFYISGNVLTASLSTTNNNWNGLNMHSTFATYAPGVTPDDLKLTTEVMPPEITTHTAEDAYKQVLKYAGASLKRDAVDTRIITEVTSGVPTYPDGGNGSTNGIIDTQDAVGGWPELSSTEAPEDTDEDGIPDAWENANALDSTDPDDAQLITVDNEYPNLEVYLNSLVSSITAGQNQSGISTGTSGIPANTDQLKVCLVSGMLQIEYNEPIQQILLLSLNGKIIRRENAAQRQVQIQIPQLPKGIYLVTITTKSHQKATAKLVL